MSSHREDIVLIPNIVELMASEAGSSDTWSSHNPPSGRYMSSHGMPPARSLFNESEVPRY